MNTGLIKTSVFESPLERYTKDLEPTFLGWDNVSDIFNKAFADLSNVNTPKGYPPHNVIKVDDETQLIQIAVAGFSEKNLDVSLKENVLTIEGNLGDEKLLDDKYIFRGLGLRNFIKTFRMIPTMEVDSVKLDNGLLEIRVVNVIPEEKKPKTLSIGYKRKK